MLAYLCLIALLSATAGLLGSYFLYSDTALDPLVIALVDEDDTVESRLAFSAITSLELYRDMLDFVYTDREQGVALLDNGIACAMIVVPDGFVSSVLTGENKPVEVLYNRAMPLKSAVVAAFADSLLDMLRSSQTGVYASLQYGRQHDGGSEYQQVFYSVNMRFLRQVLTRGDYWDTEVVQATGTVGAFTHYFFAAYVCLLLLAAILFCDIPAALGRYALLRLRACGTGPIKTAMAAFPAYFTCLLLLSFLLWVGGLAVAGIGGLPLEFPPLLFLSTLPIPLACASFALFCSVLCPNGFLNTLLVTAFASLGLLLSGGVLPRPYLASSLQAAGRTTLSFWAMESLSGDRMALIFVLLYAALFLLLACAVLALRGRTGRRL